MLEMIKEQSPKEDPTEEVVPRYLYASCVYLASDSSCFFALGNWGSHNRDENVSFNFASCVFTQNNSTEHFTKTRNKLFKKTNKP